MIKNQKTLKSHICAAIVLFFPYFALSPSPPFAEIAQDLETLAPALLRRYGALGAQVYVFDAEGGFGGVYGFTDAERNTPVQEATLFQGGGLVRPLTAYVALQSARRHGLVPDGSLSEFLERSGKQPGVSVENSFSPDLSLASLLTMTSGLPVSGGEFLAVGESFVLADYLRGRLRLSHAPGLRVAVSAEGYGYVQLLVEAWEGAAFDPLLLESMRSFGMQRSRLVFAVEGLSPGFQPAGKYFVPVKPVAAAVRAADNLYMTAAEYAGFLQFLVGKQTEYLKGELLKLKFSLQPSLGGMGYGFQLLHTGEQADRAGFMYQVIGDTPGYCARAFFWKDGRGAVVLGNGDRSHFCRELGRFLIRFLQPEAFASGQRVVRAADVAGLEGVYRPENILPHSFRFLNFLNDVRIGFDAEEGLQLNKVLQDEQPIQLVPLGVSAGADVFVVAGNADMHGWRVAFRRDANGEGVGFDTDLIRYHRIAPIFSALAIATGLGLLLVLPLILVLFYVLSRFRGGAKVS